ncbi:plus-3-domain-containing protein [Patellaria atrata CBS 101060]|uniref:Plus-3-domain-containing protein n=1 Tax=Patellaria atrata CBS 101060 TaxID=1346257 RepID=A0A9P4SCF3_9PEZI|nr:plus-3-domain-containing protein [Patellaria atrata CBS 101060]
MSESEDDAPAVLEDDDVMFPIDGVFYSEKDKDEIMALPEIEREFKLAERREEAEKRAQDASLRRMLQQRNANDKKRKATDEDDGQRKSSRQKTKASESLEKYKRQREQRGKQRSDRENKPRDRRSASKEKSASDVDAEGDSDDFDRRPTREEALPDLKDFQRIKVGRSNFAKVCFYPGFEEAIAGCFVRVNVGVNTETGQNSYRMCQIKKFIEGKPYPLEGKEGKIYHPDQYAEVSQGSEVRSYPFNSCSDSPFTESELNRYKMQMTKDGMKMPKKSFLVSKCDDIQNFITRQWNDHEIQAKVDKQNKNKTFNPNKVLTASEQTQSRLRELNKDIRRKNIENTNLALMREKQERIKARKMAAQRAKEEQAKKELALLQVPKNKAIDELFESGESRAGTPGASGSEAAKKKSTRETDKRGIPTFKKRNMDDDLIAAMDLGIEIDI